MKIAPKIRVENKTEIITQINYNELGVIESVVTKSGTHKPDNLILPGTQEYNQTLVSKEQLEPLNKKLKTIYPELEFMHRIENFINAIVLANPSKRQYFLIDKNDEEELITQLKQVGIEARCHYSEKVKGSYVTTNVN